MNEIDKSLILANEYARASGLQLSTVGRKFADHGSFFAALQNGTKTVTMMKLEKVNQRFSDNWPDDLPWPDGIERPKPSKNEKGAA